MADRRIGQTAKLKGKDVVWSGNHGWQSPASHNKLKEDGKFKTGTQALDRFSQAVSKAIPKPVKELAAAYAADKAKQAADAQANNEKTSIGRLVNKVNSFNATDRVLQYASDKTNVDRRLVDLAATAATAAIAAKALKGGVKANQPRSVGAAASKDVASNSRYAIGRFPSNQRPADTIRARGPRPTETVAPTARRFTIGNRTQTAPTKRTLRAASNTSSAYKQSLESAAAKRVVNTQKGSFTKPTSADLQRYKADLTSRVSELRHNPKGVADGEPWDLVKAPLQGPTRNSKQPVQGRIRTKPKPTRSLPKHEQVQRLKSSLRDRGADYVQETLRGQNAAGQARGPRTPSSNGTTYAPGNGRELSVRKRSTNSVKGDVRTNAERVASDRRQAFIAKADKAISERMSSEKMLAKSGTERRSIKNTLSARARSGAKRVHDAAYRESVRNASNTRQDTLRYRGSGRQAFQEPNQMNEGRNRAGGLTEAQVRARSGPVRSSRGSAAPSGRTQQYQNLGEVKSGFKRAGKVKPPAPKPADRRQNLTRFSRQGTRPFDPDAKKTSTSRAKDGSKVENKPLGLPKPSVGNTQQRRADTLPTPRPITRKQQAERSRTVKADRAFRARNKAGQKSR